MMASGPASGSFFSTFPFFSLVCATKNTTLTLYTPQGSYRQVCVKFKYSLRTSKDFPTVFKD